MAQDSIGPKISALSPKQERRLVAYLDNEFIELTRGYKKRSTPSSHVPTLSSYVSSARKILSLTLQIPPINPSTSLRVQLLLRLTNDILGCIPGYPPSAENLDVAMDWLDDVDQAWVVVLRRQRWNPDSGDEEGFGENIDDVLMEGMKSSPMNQTERTRLKSLLMGGVATLEEWLEGKTVGGSATQVRAVVNVQAELNDIFSNTLEELGGSGLAHGVVELESEDVECATDPISMEID